eukprot:TRINITY_DN11041_c0_g1_i7.p3 TRINITY_DN11041_c0_g1~~TRINITY_DN11041_c0_g1_i7.p3  ORF type:complete len:115 (+),score=17.74 TRINITY_DN11041_c0_g1_i7:227-571(+)
MFEYRWHDKTLRALHDPSYCVVTDDNSLAPSTKAQLWKCDQAGASKYWVAEDRQVEGSNAVRFLSNRGDVCLGVDTNQAQNGEHALLASASLVKSTVLLGAMMKPRGLPPKQKP